MLSGKPEMKASKQQQHQGNAGFVVITDTRPSFEVVNGTEQTIFFTHSRRSSRGQTPITGASSTSSTQGKQRAIGSPISFDEMRSVNPGVFSAALGYSSNKVVFQDKPRKEVLKPIVRRPNQPINCEAEVIAKLETRYPMSQGKLTKPFSASTDTASLMSCNSLRDNSSILEGLVTSFDFQSFNQSDASMLSQNSAFRTYAKTNRTMNDIESSPKGGKYLEHGRKHEGRKNGGTERQSADFRGSQRK